ncbi:MAG TPA: hypothetical protein VK400_17770 [Pyrinomonadaceae bacterium]|nr:hypothetical protein [Pyrinomonadaceae bacterium]
MMSEQAFTLAMYRVKEGEEKAFVSAWSDLAETFSSLPNPPIWELSSVIKPTGRFFTLSDPGAAQNT